MWFKTQFETCQDQKKKEKNQIKKPQLDHEGKRSEAYQKVWKKERKGKKDEQQNDVKKMNISALIFYYFFKNHSVYNSEKKVQMRHPTKLSRS